jgi:hypothetical protein
MVDVLKQSIQSMFEQIVMSVPTLGFALLILLFGWIFAKIVGGLITKYLHRTDLDNRLIRNLGMERLLTEQAGKERSVERIIGRLVYYFILLFVVVAFFNALNIPLVTDPINQMLVKITGAVPNIFEALLILFIAWAIGSLARAGVTRLIRASGIQEKVDKWGLREEQEGKVAVPLAESTGNLVFYLILLFAIPPFMDALGQSAVVAPLRDMFTLALGFLPNLFSAVVILFIGWIAAKVVKEIVSNLLVNAGIDSGVERLGLARVLGGVRFSLIVGYIAYFFILVPAIVASLDALKLQALSEPITVQLTRILNAVPSLILAFIIVIAGYIIAQLLRNLFVTFLTNVGFNTLPARMGLPALVPKEGTRTLSEISGSVLVAVIMLFVAMEAFKVIGITQLSELTQEFIYFLPRVFFALVLIAGGLALGNYVKGLLGGMVQGKGPLAALMPQAAKIALIIFSGAMALQQLGIGDEIVTAAFVILFGALSLAVALGVGLGSKDLVGEYLKRFSKSIEKESK